MYLQDMFLPSESEKSTGRIKVLLVVCGLYLLHWLEASYNFWKRQGQVVELCGYLVSVQCMSCRRMCIVWVNRIVSRRNRLK
jgi:hypothetical protein